MCGCLFVWVTCRVQARVSVCATRRAQAHGFYRFIIELSSYFRVWFSSFGCVSGFIIVFRVWFGFYYRVSGVFRVLLSCFGCVSGFIIVFWVCSESDFGVLGVFRARFWCFGCFPSPTGLFCEDIKRANKCSFV